MKRWLLPAAVACLTLELGLADFLKDLYQFTELPRQLYYLTLQFLPRAERGFLVGIPLFALLALIAHLHRRTGRRRDLAG